MRRLTPLPLAAGVALAASLAPDRAAADVYKVVGPDGRITYSDQKPAPEARAGATVIGAAGTRRPLVVPTVAASGLARLDLPPASAAEAPARQAILGLGRGNASRDPDLVEALIVAAGYETLVDGYLDTCGAAMPSSIGRFNAAAKAWRGANAQVIVQATQLRANMFSAPQQAAIQTIAQTRADLVLGPAKTASSEPRIRWCDDATDALKGNVLGLAAKPAVAHGLERYVTR